MPNKLIEGDIDPKRLDVLEQPRKRRVRTKPEPPSHLAAGKAAAESRANKRPLSPGIMLEPVGEQGYAYTAPHSDLELWDLQLADALGTRSLSVMRTFVRQLKGLVAETWDDAADRWKPNETQLNAALAFVAGIKPRNEAEAALAAQMVAVHWMQMKMSRQALRYGSINSTDAGVAGKLARTYVMQLDALAKLRGKRTSRQSIKVSKELHQHVHYHHHRGDDETQQQPHEAPDAGQPEELRALPGPDPVGRVVPIASGKRKARV